ncbi:uncharacterized protein [Palaemon carinicauda]|uniref:uncharacterized protein n=1 Tax=Palaemon carinicauda TaxID=392227 RepID=UPI0035B67783
MGKPTFCRDSDLLKPINPRPRRSLRLPTATHPYYDNVCHLETERDKLKHVSELAQHPKKARKLALKRSDSLKLRAKNTVNNPAISPKREWGKCPQDCQVRISPNEPQLIKFKCMNPSESQISCRAEPESTPRSSVSHHLPRWLVTPSSGSDGKSPENASSSKGANPTTQIWKEDMLKKTRKPRKLLMQVLKTSGQILRASTASRRDRDFTKRRRISIPEVELLKMKSTLEENL